MCRSRRLYSDANAWKKVGNVPRTPSAISTTVAIRIGRRAGFCRRHSPWSTAHEATYAITAMIVLPESGPTSSSNSRKSCTPVLASLSVVSKPSTNAPIPAARTAAATGPVGRSTSSSRLETTSSLICLASRDRRRLRDQSAEQARNRRGREGPGKNDEHKQPGRAVPSQDRPIVEDEEGGERRQHRRDPGDVLFPLHPKLVPVLRLPRHVREQEVPRRALVARHLQPL